MFIYKLLSNEYTHNSNLEEFLNKEGEDNWELINIIIQESKKFDTPNKAFCIFKKFIEK